MAIFTRADLMRVYSWSTDGGDNPKLRGEPDSSLLDRTEGYEVLYMIRSIMIRRGLATTDYGRKIERMIHACPTSLRSQLNVKEWIDTNWYHY